MSNTDYWYVTFIESIELSKNVMSTTLSWMDWIGCGSAWKLLCGLDWIGLDWIGSISCYFGLDWVKKKWPMSNSALGCAGWWFLLRDSSRKAEWRPRSTRTCWCYWFDSGVQSNVTGSSMCMERDAGTLYIEWEFEIRSYNLYTLFTTHGTHPKRMRDELSNNASKHITSLTLSTCSTN